MTTPASQIAASDINDENGYASTQQLSWDDSIVRALAQITTPQSQISLLDLRSKTRPTSGSQTFTSGSGNFIVPAGVYSLTYSIVGGGGGGSGGYQIGGRNNGYTFGDIVGGAGGGAGRRISQTLAVTPGQVIPYVVGAAGANSGGGGYANTAGTSGGTSSFAGVTATGGGAGKGYNSSGGGGNPADRTGGTGAAGSPGGSAGTQPNNYGNSTSIGVPQGGAGVVVNGVTYGTGGNGGPANPNTLGTAGVGGVVHVSWVEGFVVSTSQQQMNLFTWLTGQGWDRQSRARVTINPGVYVWSDSTSIAALTTGAPYPNGLTIINNGYIMGKGGNGNSTMTVAPYGMINATPGGAAISIGATCTITNNSFIGGGGGGGAGGSLCGGGGAGGGKGGISGTDPYAPGGAGGAIGQVGANGGTASSAIEIDQNFPTGRFYFGGGGGGGRIFPGTGGAGGTGSGVPRDGSQPTATGGYGGGAGGGGGANDVSPGAPGGSAGNPGVTATSYSGCGGGGGWGAPGGANTGNAGGGAGAGGKAISLNGFSVTRNGTGTTYGVVS